ncbi:MAG TPA: choice-of-anchor Q domain-containing protein [Candidatus Acidoferrum sp.]|nr:choice-of-anchor Q domain-containing protein [Candidatus Acidoferrum sp.]
MKITLSQIILALLLAGPNLFAVTHYVSPASPSPTPPYTNWVTAATNIQQAVNAALAGDEVVVTNGVYPGGVTVTNPLALRSVNGPQFTVINGGGPCVSLTNGVSLTGFTLTNGSGSGYFSGGAYCASANAFLTNCVIAGNSAVYEGGGVYGGTLYNCVLAGNSAGYGGGGAEACTLYNCTLTGNSAHVGGGAHGCALYNCTLSGNSAGYGNGGGAHGSTLCNCIVYFNTAAYGSNYYSSLLSNSCTMPYPIDGSGNITNTPLFVNNAGGNLRLLSNSPCINAGNNAWATTATDLDGNSRIVGGTVDMGAYESQTPVLLNYYLWLQGYGLPTDAANTYADSDGDGVNNWEEYLADTSPVDAQDYLHITRYTREGTYNTLWWTSKSTRLYQVQRCVVLDGSSPWETIITNALAGWNNVGFDNMGPQYFYRISAVPP